MNCEQANQVDMVDYLNSLGYQPQKIRGADYWYFSPFRDENDPSSKINRNKNVWYDHGPGTGGKLVDFVMEFYRCDISEALQKISSFHRQNNFQNNVIRPQFHLHENSLVDNKDARETAIKIIAAKQPIQNLMLCRYLLQRRIDKSIADSYCHEVHFISEASKIQRKNGRPKKAVRKEIIRSIRFSKTEYFIVKQHASRSGLKITVYIRQMALHGQIISRLNEEERQFVRQLIGMANNLNQLTKKGHQEGFMTAVLMFEKYKNFVGELLEKLNRND